MDNVTLDNRPVIDLASALDPAALAIWLEYQYSDHAARNSELMGAYARFLEATKEGIHEEVIAGRATDFAKQLKAEQSATDETRKRIKDPVLHAQRMIDGSAKKLTDNLVSATATVQTKLTAFLRAKEAEARRKAEEEAARKDAEAQALIAAAEQSNAPEAIETAVAAIEQAQTAAAQATASPLELSRTRSQLGSLTGLKDNWTYTIADLSKVPAHLLTLNDAAVKLAIKQGARDIPGLTIFNDAKAMIR